MRIRKRKVQLPFSSLSDPPPVQQLLHGGADTAAHLQLLLPPPSSSSSVDDPPPNLHLRPSDFRNLVNNKLQQQDHTRERNLFGGAETGSRILSQSSSSSSQVVGQWCEREKAFPLKKRRGSFEIRPSPSDEPDDQTTTTTTTTIKSSPDETKTSKKYTLPQHQSKPGLDLVGKKKSRGGALMEGSRCSRVNGRGWRCCQQTLVGYSLCEHHLGKGRLRSMNSVRNRSLAAAALKTVVIVAADGEDEKKSSPSSSPPTLPPALMLARSKKRMKLGVVKARSISSLLGQTDSVVAVVAPPPPRPPHEDSMVE